MPEHFTKHPNWKAIALTGACSIAAPIVAGYLDVVTGFNFDFISRHFGIFLLIGLFGLLIAFVGCIGWARHLTRGRKALMAAVVFAAPWVVLLLGYPIAGTSVHGPGALVMSLIIPAAILALILLAMAASNPPLEKRNGPI